MSQPLDRARRSTSRVVALTGVLGPVCFVLAVIVGGALRSPYSHATQMISELGETGGSYSNVMNYGGFVPAGVLLVAFAASLFCSFSPARSSVVGTGLVAAFGAGILAAGIFSCDAGCVSQTPSREGLLHILVSLVAFAGGIGGTFAWAVHFRKRAAWSGLARYSTWSGGIALLFLFATIVSVSSPGTPTESRTLTGVWQRILVGVLFLWCAVVAIRTYGTPPGLAMKAG